ncbi:MAG: hypothetical protein K1X74_05710 [Pirellulales bacterium]|nr:hypothetical protein [Pirellulales bacterium]
MPRAKDRTASAAAKRFRIDGPHRRPGPPVVEQTALRGPVLEDRWDTDDPSDVHPPRNEDLLAD